MQIQEVKNEKLAREYRVTIPEAALAKAVDTELKRLSGRVKIPGFRPGHVPANVMKQRYGDNVQAEAIDREVKRASQQVMKEKNLRPATQARISALEFGEGKPLEFTLALEVLPEIPEIDFAAVTLEKWVADVTDQDIDGGLERVAERNKELVDKDGPAETGDVVTIDFEGRVDGVAFEGGAGKGVKLEIDSRHFIPGFEEQLKGKKAGDAVDVQITFPENYFKKELAGKAAVFAVTLHQVQAQKAPEINDEFATKMGFETLEKLKESMRKQFEGDYAGIARTKMKKALFDRMNETCSFDLPESMVEQEFTSIWKQIEQAKTSGNEEVKGKTDDELKKEYRDIAERRVRLGLLLSEVSLRNKITVSKEEMNRAMANQAGSFPGQEQKVFEFYQKNPGYVEDLRGPILEDKAVDFILSRVTAKEKKVTSAELLAEDETTD